MCTVSWLFSGDSGYDVFFNRDESRERKPALRPEIRESGAVRFVAPTDGDFGGTWLAVNERGVTVGVLNRYGDDVPEREYTSRGLLLFATSPGFGASMPSRRAFAANSCRAIGRSPSSLSPSGGRR